MNLKLIKPNKNSLRRLVFGLVAVAVNFLFAFASTRFKMPFYLDTIGTIATAAVAGAFPGIMVAVATNIICSVFNLYSIYYTMIGSLVAICTVWFVSDRRLRPRYRIPLYVLLLAICGGGIALIFQWVLQGQPQFTDVSDAAQALTGQRSGTLFFFGALLVNIGLNIVDKGLTSGIAFLVIRILPKEYKESLSNSRWKQKPLTDSEIKEMTGIHAGRNERGQGLPLRTRMMLMLVLAALVLTVALGFVSVMLHFETTKTEYTENARKAAKFAATVVEADRINEFMKDGEKAARYLQIENTLYSIRDNAAGVKYLYVIKIEKDGCYVVFDLDTEDTPAYKNGDKIEFEKAFEPYLPALFAGEAIEEIESDDISGWVLTIYEPIRNGQGVTVAYACADVSMDYLSDYVKTYLVRMILVFSGFVVLIIGYGLWVSDYSLVYPVGKMVSSVEGFIKGGGEQDILDENVRSIRRLDIRTNDEIERLYESICKMASNVTEQMRSIRHYADATAKMQNGLILTMADMVESRDSDTGAHVQKTSAYVRIILEGLKEKGYYASKLSTKYMIDVEMSAPLHDVGKINIPDAVLNKPGKLLPEEFEIMKTHTTAGKEILEKAINTVKGGSYLKEARNMAAYHHERWDGKGYPEGLHGEVIPLSARVMAVADVFDALASPRVYKPAFPLDKALSIIEEGAGTQFDPKVVEVFMEHLDEVKQVLRKYQE
ncbi:MAG: HD domain-containing protein [Lachnospiraceae bacterium]|nr:HD domain-containing protein [Lachnospiraceae bacterium]